MTTLYHTSPTPITEIRTDGRFGGALFFSPRPYHMTAGDAITYTIDASDISVTDASSLFFDDNADRLDVYVQQLADRLGIDTDTAEALIDESTTVYDIDADIDPADLADVAWDVQAYTFACAKELGFDGVIVSDEQGSAWIIEMADRADSLTLVN